MGGGLQKCGQLTNTATEIMQSTFMGKVESHHTFKRKNFSLKKSCGTYVDPPPNDVWYQCPSCHNETLKRLGREIIVQKEPQSQLKIENFLSVPLKDEINQFEEQIQELVKGSNGQIYAKQSHVEVFNSSSSQFKVEFKKSFPESKIQLKHILTKILQQEIQTLKNSQENPKKIRKLFVSLGQYGKTRIDIFVQVIHIENSFGIAWCFFLSGFTVKIQKEYWEKTPYENVIQPKAQVFGEIFKKNYHVDY